MKCQVCGGTTTCPGGGVTAGRYFADAAAAGLSADWRPPLARYGGDKGPHYLDTDRLELPPGVSYKTIGAAQSRRLAAHGIRTWWVSTCRYLALISCE